MFFHYHSLDLLLQGPNLILSVFGGLLDFKKNWFQSLHPCIGILIFCEGQNALDIDKFLYWNSFFSETWGLSFSTQECLKKSLTFEEYWVQKNIKCVLATDFWWFKKTRNLLYMDSSGLLNSCFCETTDLISVFKDSKAFYLQRNIQLFYLIFFLRNRFLVDQNFQKLLLGMTRLNFQICVCSALPASFFHERVNR